MNRLTRRLSHLLLGLVLLAQPGLAQAVSCPAESPPHGEHSMEMTEHGHHDDQAEACCEDGAFCALGECATPPIAGECAFSHNLSGAHTLPAAATPAEPDFAPHPAFRPPALS